MQLTMAHWKLMHRMAIRQYMPDGREKGYALNINHSCLAIGLEDAGYLLQQEVIYAVNKSGKPRIGPRWFLTDEGRSLLTRPVRLSKQPKRTGMRILVDVL